MKADGAADVHLRYLSTASAEIKRTDGQPMPRVTLVDSSPYTIGAVFDQTCRVSLSIVSNEPDVDSAAEAEAIIDALEADVSAKTVIRDRYKELTLYHRAFLFMQSVANNFLVELTNETIQQLRSVANDSLDAMIRLMFACGDMPTGDGGTLLSDADRQNLMILYMSLPQLGAASDWVNADGGTKTLADFVGPSAQEVLATVQKLAAQADQADSGVDYDAAYQQAATDVVTAEAKLAQARTQLASWLN